MSDYNEGFFFGRNPCSQHITGESHMKFFLRSFFGHFLTSGGSIPANIMFRPVKIDLERDMISIEKNLKKFFVAHTVKTKFLKVSLDKRTELNAI